MKSIGYCFALAVVVWALVTPRGLGGESDDRSKSALLAKLASRDPEIQAQALFDIGFGHDGVLSGLPALVDIATTSNSENRCKALKIIAEIGPHAASVSTQLYGLLRHESTRVRIAAADAVLSLESRNERAVEVLGAALKEPDANLRKFAAEVLHWRGLAGAHAIPQLIAACSDRDAKVRSEAAQALGSVTPARREDVVQALRDLLSDTSSEVQKSAAKSLWELDEPADQLVPTLAKLVEQFQPDPTRNVPDDIWGHDAGVELIGKIGPEAKSGVPGLIAALDSPQVGERLAAAKALGNIGLGATPAVERLAKTLRDTEVHTFPYAHHAWHVSDQAAESLRKIGGASRPVLLSALVDPDERVRALAAQQLSYLPADREMVAAVLPLLDDKVESVRAIAAYSLGRMGNTANAAAPQLARLLNDEGKWTSYPGGGIGTTYGVGSHAFQALVTIRPQGKEFIEALRKRLESDRRMEPACLEMLLRLGPAAIDLVTALEPLLRDPKARLPAAQALAGIDPGHPGLLEILQSELGRDEDGYAIKAARAIALLGPQATSAIPALYKLSEAHEEPSEKAILAAAIIRIDPTEQNAVLGLAAALREPISPHYTSAGHAEALATWRALGPRAIPAEELLVAGLTLERDYGDEDIFRGPRENAESQLECAKLLVDVGLISRPVIDALIRLCNSDDCITRGNTADTIARVGPAAFLAVPALVRMLPDNEMYLVGGDFYGNGGIRHLPGDHAAEALIKIGEPAVPALTAALQDEDRRVRAKAAQVLGGIGSPAHSAADDLLVALKDPAFIVRAAAADALGQLQDDRDATVASLAERLSDTHLLVRVAAARAIGRLGTRAKAVVSQIERLQQDPFEEAQQAARHAIQQISS